MKKLCSLLVACMPLTVMAEGEKKQAVPPPTQKMTAEAFEPSGNTVIRWMGNSSFLINSRGTVMLIDPLLENKKIYGYDLLIDLPMASGDVPDYDLLLLTHEHHDHYDPDTIRKMGTPGGGMHSPHRVAELLKEEGFTNAHGYNIHDKFTYGPYSVTLTPTVHTTKPEECAGFWIETPDGVIWNFGDTDEVLDSYLNMPVPDVILTDFTHMKMEGTARVVNQYPDTPLIIHHWGTVNAPDFGPFNGDPDEFKKYVVNPERVIVLAPGESYELKKRLPQKG